MGGWFASLGLGGYLSGSIGAYWEHMPHSRFFLMVVGILVVVAVPLSLRGTGETDLVLTVDGQIANTVRVNIQ